MRSTQGTLDNSRSCRFFRRAVRVLAPEMASRTLLSDGEAMDAFMVSHHSKRHVSSPSYFLTAKGPLGQRSSRSVNIPLRVPPPGMPFLSPEALTARQSSLESPGLGFRWLDGVWVSLAERSRSQGNPRGGSVRFDPAQRTPDGITVNRGRPINSPPPPAPTPPSQPPT